MMAFDVIEIDTVTFSALREKKPAFGGRADGGLLDLP
jgi:hypothetical protein